MVQQKQNVVTLLQDDNKKHSLQRTNSKKQWICRILMVVLYMAPLLCMVAWIYHMHVEMEAMRDRLSALEQVSINQERSTNNNKGQVLKRAPRVAIKKSKFCTKLQRCNIKQFETVHLVLDANDPKGTHLTQGALVKKWKLDETNDKTAGVTYDSTTGEVSVNVTGYYHVYAQLRPHQAIKQWYPKDKKHFPEWFSFSLYKTNANGDGKEIASAIWNSNLSSQTVARTTYLTTKDKIGVKMGLEAYGDFKCFSNERFTFFGLHLLSASTS